MKTAVVMLALTLLSQVALAYDVRIRVVDETGAPIAGAEAVISFVGVLQEQSVTHRGRTGPDGTFSASGRSLLEVYLEARKSGHYVARVDGLSPKRDLDEVVVLPRILKPVPLYAWDTRIGRATPGPTFSIQNEWLGFDFEAADWVSPHGRGRVADIRFRFRNEFKGYEDNIKDLDEEIAFSKRAFAARREEWTEEKFKLRAGKWDAELEIAFPGEREGMYEEPRFWPYSQMKMPHQAPEAGYVPTWRYTDNTYSPTTTRENVGFFLRTRVKLDEAGNIVSANYAKVVGDFHLDARGWVMFCYYFNPVPNDRNLEFDPKRNLFPAGFPGSNVNEP